MAPHGISHLTTPPHTPQHNGTTERRNRHVTETGLTLMHHASIILKFLPHAFQATFYLIKRLSTPILNLKAPFSMLFKHPPSYNKLKDLAVCVIPGLSHTITTNFNQNHNLVCSWDTLQIRVLLSVLIRLVIIFVSRLVIISRVCFSFNLFTQSTRGTASFTHWTSDKICIGVL